LFDTSPHRPSPPTLCIPLRCCFHAFPLPVSRLAAASTKEVSPLSCGTAFRFVISAFFALVRARPPSSRVGLFCSFCSEIFVSRRRIILRFHSHRRSRPYQALLVLCTPARVFYPASTPTPTPPPPSPPPPPHPYCSLVVMSSRGRSAFLLMPGEYFPELYSDVVLQVLKVPAHGPAPHTPF